MKTLIAAWREPRVDDECTLYTMGKRAARIACADELESLCADAQPVNLPNEQCLQRDLISQWRNISNVIDSDEDRRRLVKCADELSAVLSACPSMCMDFCNKAEQLRSSADALLEYADLQDMVTASGGTFPIHLNSEFLGPSCRHYAEQLRAYAAQPPAAGVAVANDLQSAVDALPVSTEEGVWLLTMLAKRRENLSAEQAEGRRLSSIACPTCRGRAELQHAIDIQQGAYD